MTMTVSGLKARLDSAFHEAEEAEADVRELTGKLERARQRANETKGLAAAARRQRKNAEAKYRVLLGRKSADADAGALADLEAKAADTRAELERASFLAATGSWLQAADEAAASLSRAADLAAEAESRAGSSAKRNELKKKADDLRTQQEELDAKLGTLKESQAQLPSAGGEGRRGAPSRDRLRSLEAAVANSERDLAKARERDADQAGVTDAELEQAAADVEEAKRAVREAPEAERSAQAELGLAGDRLEDARERLRLAIEKRDKAEALVVDDIDLAGPGADGFLTATARLRQDVPDGYELSWTVAGSPAPADRDSEGKSVRVDARQLPAGRYAIEVRLERAS